MFSFSQAAQSSVFGAQGVRFFFVLEGEVSVYSYEEERDKKEPEDEVASPGEEQRRLVATLKRGQSFGDSYVLNPNKPFQHCVRSITAAKVRLGPLCPPSS